MRPRPAIARARSRPTGQAVAAVFEAQSPVIQPCSLTFPQRIPTVALCIRTVAALSAKLGPSGPARSRSRIGRGDRPYRN
jgi:hypothetical protein